MAAVAAAATPSQEASRPVHWFGPRSRVRLWDWHRGLQGLEGHLPDWQVVRQYVPCSRSHAQQCRYAHQSPALAPRSPV